MVALEELWEHHGERLRRFIGSRVGLDADRDDLLQDVFSKAHAAGLDGVLDPESWLFQIASRAVTDHYRRRGAEERRLHHAAEAPASPDEAPSRLAACLKPMMEALPEPDRRALADVPAPELARELGISVSGAKSRVQRARARLKERLLDCCVVELDGRGQPLDFSLRPSGPCSVFRSERRTAMDETCCEPGCCDGGCCESCYCPMQ